jgi:uncharacterized radical SAM superfamily Fe-S cluster-containing enzyme
MTSKIIRRTFSVCPVCLKRLPADIVKEGQNYALEKTCPEHGRFSAVVWRGDFPAFESWCRGAPPLAEAPDCPTACGLCKDHLRKTCCALVEVTGRCNLKCPVCFASAGAGTSGAGDGGEPSVPALSGVFRRLAGEGNTFVQLSGGEPTVRDDLPEIVAAARDAGCDTVQLNSNGLRLGADPAYTKALRDAGLSFVFMQFDGTEDRIYKKLRGRPLLEQKTAAIRVCDENRIGVTLVPTVVPGVNDHNIGSIIDFGIKNSPAVRGVHFQPVSYFGRYPAPPLDKDRITLQEILRAIEKQTGGKLKIADFVPSACDHPRCGFHGDFVVLPKGVLLRLTAKTKKSTCCSSPSAGDTAHLKNRNFVSRRWKRPDGNGPEPENADYRDLTAFLSRVRSHGFTVTAMAFQDAWTLDLERLRSCSLHVAAGGKTIPFCANYLTAHTG